MSKTKTLLERLGQLLKRPSQAREASNRAELRALLKKLKKRQHQLEQEREHEHDKHRRKQLKREIAVIREQRRKGLSVYRQGSD